MTVIKDKDLKTKLNQLYIHRKCLVNEAGILQKIKDILKQLKLDFIVKNKENGYFEVRVSNFNSFALLPYLS